MIVCFFGAWDPEYPRNRVLRAGLRRAGVTVTEARVAEHRAFRRWPALALAFARAGRDADVVFVPEFRHKDVPLARALAGRRRLVFDPLVSRWDTLVHDWGLHREGGLQARWNRRLDRWSLGLADVVWCDTWAHGELYAALGVPRARLRRVLVGCEDAFFAVGPPPPEDVVRITYLGGFLPLHGVSVMIEAAVLLERASGLPPWRMALVGRGITYEAAREHVARLGLERVDLPGATAYADSPRVLAESHVVLGAFGTSPKAGRVIPHKVYQGLAAGRAVVTGDGAGVREVFTPGTHLELVTAGDARALAATLERLLRDPGRRACLGAAGRRRALDVASPMKVGEQARLALMGEGERMPDRG
ncbi:MAG TPA: glycosyltransferase [Candidatus Eisenbacteria bacterium]|nr:glycosyltransferase [Candidatus Eisenbacteria bacterium]